MSFFYDLFSVILSIFVTLYPEKTYTEGFIGQPKSFLPNEAVTENSKTISSLIFRGLFKYDEQGNLTEDLADYYEVSDDGLSYTVYLKKGQKWTNGVEITADDLLYSAFTDPHLKEIATDKIDKYSIRYTLPNKFSPFPHVLTSGIIPGNIELNPISPISSGPYKVVRIKKEGPNIKEVVLKAVSEEYNIPRLAFRYYEDYNQLFTAFKLGEIDGFLSNEDLSYNNMERRFFPQNGIYQAIIFNLRNEKFSNLEVRKKLQKATPVKEIAAGKGEIVQGPISKSPYTDDKLVFDTYDTQFKENLNLDLTLIFPDTKEHRGTAETLKKAWANVGVRLTLSPKTSSEIENVVVENRDFEVLIYGQEVSRDPDRYVLWHSTRVKTPGLNLSGFQNIRLDRAIEEGRYAIDFEDRVKHYENFQSVVADNVPVIFLYHPTANFYVSDKLKFPQSELSYYYASDRFHNVKDWDIL